MRLTHLLVPVAACLALGLPGLAEAAPKAKKSAAKKMIKDAKASPFYKRSMSRDQIKANGLEKVQVANGTTMNFLKYVKGSALDARPELAPLFKPDFPAGVLDGTPKYTEVIHELEDRLIVERTITVPLADGACDKPNKIPKAVRGLCFRKTGKGKPTKGLTKEIADIRAKLAAADPAKIVKGTVTAEQAAKMDDAKLLDLLLNHDDRKIKHVSIVPRLQPDKSTSVDALDVKLTPAPAELPSKVKGGSTAPTKPPHAGFPTSAKTFDTKYFLTGFTFGRQFSDTWEYTIADSTWLTDRYYIKFEYLLSLGFGVRAPFSMDVKSAAGSGGVDVELSVDPVATDDNGLPAFPAVGLPENKYFGGKEFVLEAYATCGLYISIPGPNVDRDCPTFGKNYSREVNPVIGSETSNIKDWWINGKDTGLGISIAVASAHLDLGIGADVTNGRIGLNVDPLANSSVSGVTNNRVSFTSRNPFVFKVSRTGNALSSAGFALSKPRYGFDIRLAPKVRLAIGVDVAIYENDWILGPWTIDALSISAGFELPHHAGTVDKHSYTVFDSAGVDEGVLDPGTSKPPKKTPHALPDTAGNAMQ